ncbi:hypothetical protein MMC09_002652 [Bachmanniomyces sp. S44760]|nr:hypothetical protein [Bachmanniomyces sp. S44760]
MTAAYSRKRRKLDTPDSEDNDSSPSTLIGDVVPSHTSQYYSNAAQWDLEQNYETKQRTTKRDDQKNTRLPIKTADGRVEHLPISELQDEQLGDVWQSAEDDNSGSELADTEVVKNEDALPKKSARQQIVQAKEELARIATLINEDPEEHAGAFKALGKITQSHNVTIKKLALATQLAVYKDVIPDYRIRPLADIAAGEKVSKDVRRLREFEQALVGSYYNYVKVLAKHAKSSRGDVPEATASLATVAISCACAMLLAKPHFNFRSELLKILVDKLSGKRVDSDFRRCREVLEELFRSDENSTPSLDAVTMLTRMMKARNFHVDEGVLNTFLHLRLLSEFSSKGSQNHVDRPEAEKGIKGKKPKTVREFRTKKQRKMLKERKVVEKEFKEADAIVSHEERDRMQAETLKMVFICYFRILKARAPTLTGAVLEGLAKYAHLINQDFFGDILEALKDLTAEAIADLDIEEDEADGEDEDDDEDIKAKRDATRESLLCIITAFALLEGQDARKAATTLNLDLHYFITHLYRNLHSLSLNPDLELGSKSLHLADPHSPSPSSVSPTEKNKINVQTTTVLLLRCLSSALLPPTSTHSVPPIRLAAFTKQLLLCTLQYPEKSSIAMLGLLSRVTKTHGRKIASLWNTEERKGDGVFDPVRLDVESSNPFASTVWEGELLRWHFSPAVREGVGAMERGIVGGVSK